MEFIYFLFESYGIWVLLVVTFLAQMGLPLGSAFFLMWYGSTLDSSSSLLVAIPAAACAAVLGDMVAFALGQRFSKQLDSAEKNYRWLSKQVKKSQKLLHSYGVLIIWGTRFLATGLGPIVNYLLGSRRYPTMKFFQWVMFGEIIFASEMLIIGNNYKDTWEELMAFIADAAWLILLLILLLWVGKNLINLNQST